MLESSRYEKIIVLTLLVFSFLNLNAQYRSIYAKIALLEAKNNENKNLKNVGLEDKRFVLIKNTDGLTIRYFISFKGNQVTYVEVKDENNGQRPSSKIYTGDFVRNEADIISVRLSFIEGKRTGLPLTKVFKLGQQKKIVYLTDIASKEKWIDETQFKKKKK